MVARASRLSVYWQRSKKILSWKYTAEPTIWKDDFPSLPLAWVELSRSALASDEGPIPIDPNFLLKFSLTLEMNIMRQNTLGKQQYEADNDP